MAKSKHKTKVPPARVRSGRFLNIRIEEQAPGSFDTRMTGSYGLAQIFKSAISYGLEIVAGKPANPAWEPMVRTESDPRIVAKARKASEAHGIPWEDGDEHWANYLYLVEVRNFDNGSSHLSIKRHDKQRIREWRHLQQIKNDICGPEREALEIFPAESRLVDQADQYHLWVVPEGERLMIGFPDREITTPEEAEQWARKYGVVVDQSEWQPGFTTGQDDGRRRPCPSCGQPGIAVEAGVCPSCGHDEREGATHA